MSATIGIIDYGMGNLRSVWNALLSVSANPVLCSIPKDLEKVSKVILPGVGAFRDCIGNLTRLGFVDALSEFALVRKLPILGICLGMQVMARRSFEGGEYLGLGWFDADVVKISPKSKELPVPHIGWNEVSLTASHPIFSGIQNYTDFYFVHSFHLSCSNRADIVGVCDYGEPITAAVAHENIVATQFHPEKSQAAGAQLLRNFATRI